MSARPRLSLCIPTWNRGRYLQGALESGLREAASQPPGTVEVLVCDNASNDDTPDIISRIQAVHPELRAFRNPENIGFDRNYLRCVEEARGEFVWIMGDDDEWLAGSVALVLRELDAGADTCLCLSEACDLDWRPIKVLQWYLDPEPPRVWHLENREDLIRYFNTCAYSAGAFGFISVGIFRRDRFLQAQVDHPQTIGIGYIHVYGMMAFARQQMRLHYIPEVMIRNRINADATNGGADPFGKWMLDLRAWDTMATALFGDDPALDAAFSRIVGRNHHNTILPGLRRHAPSDEAWLEAGPYLIRAGFSPVRIAAVDFAFRWVREDRHPLPTLRPGTLCVVDLPLLTRGAERIAILALGLQSLLDGAALIAALRNAGRTEHIRVFCSPECAELLDGFEVQCLDPERYSSDVPYRETIAQTIIDFTPELVVNLDRNRGIQADDLAAAAVPAGAVAFELPASVTNAGMIKASNGSYTCLIPVQAGFDAMLAALGLKASPPALWPSPEARGEALLTFKELGWTPGRTLAVLADQDSILEDSDLFPTLEATYDQGYTFLGMGDLAVRAHLETLLGPMEGRALNLAGRLSPGAMAALLQLCSGYLGQRLPLQSMARACGCAPFPMEGPQ